ncbi:MAG: GNAT family N-acetyltransferase [Nitrospirae bacterium]|nr:GNAT family N-acetyltransferase [Nitrospirota bacterium]
MNYLVRQADLQKDEATVLYLWKGNLPDCSAERYRAIYRDNTYGSSWAWLAYTDNEAEIIGTTGLCQRKVFINGKAVSAGVAIDFAILKEHRGFGPALKLQRQVTTGNNERGLDFIYAFPNKQAESVFQRVRYKSIGKMSRWVKVLRSHYKLKEILRSDLLSAAVSPLVDLVVAKTFHERAYKKSKVIQAESISAFDKRFDVLWEKARGQFNVIGERTADFLTWRFGRFLKDNRRIFCMTDNLKQDLLGYIVYHIKDNLCYMDDILFLNATQDIDALLAEFIAAMRREKVFAVSVSCLGSSVLVEKLEAWGFVRRESERSIMIFADKEFEYAQLVSDKENWHLLEGDDI